MTAADLLRMPRGKFRYELVKGELHAMSPAGSAHGAVTQRLSTLLDQYVAGNGLGLVFGAETGFLVDRNPDTVRAPDIAFVRRDRISADGPPDGYWQGAPDLAVEVASPGDTPREIEQKVSEWFDAGCHLVWVIRPRLKTLAIHRAGDEPEILAGDATLDGAPVLAGFCCQLADVFSVIRGP
ncbi:MAG: Uma2 family endonuclease [Planctomycetia bacterium]|nr:Uma2 family endonuclease [Planctomycetia bacterium]